VSALEASLTGAIDLSPEWKTEIARRIHAVESGESRLVPGEEVAARVRAALHPR
jgi:putative addiction module component (TIGR02574 family)